MDASTADALFNLGNQLDDEGRFDEAIDAYQKSASISEFGGADHVADCTAVDTLKDKPF